MNPYIGDRQLEPDDSFYNPSVMRKRSGACRDVQDEELEDCMPDMSDPGEPNEDPE